MARVLQSTGDGGMAYPVFKDSTAFPGRLGGTHCVGSVDVNRDMCLMRVAESTGSYQTLDSAGPNGEMMMGSSGSPRQTPNQAEGGGGMRRRTARRRHTMGCYFDGLPCVIPALFTPEALGGRRCAGLQKHSRLPALLEGIALQAMCLYATS